MDHWILPLLYATGAFILGWFARGWKDSIAEREEQAALEADEAEFGKPRTRWICPQCQRRRDLPTELDQKVLVCNLCQVRLQRDDGLRR